MASKSTSKIGTLPPVVRERVNEHLRDNSLKLRPLAEWIFTQPDQDGTFLARRWLGENENLEAALHACEVGLSNWSRGEPFKAWRAERNLRDDDLMELESIEAKMGMLGGDKQVLRSLMAQSLMTLKSRETPVDEKIKSLVAIAKAIDALDKTKLDRDRFEIQTCEMILDAYGNERARKISESNIPRAEQIAQLRQVYFADIDALEKSGEVKLPA